MTDLFSAMATGSEASLRIIPFLHQKHRVVAAFFTPSHAARTSSVRQNASPNVAPKNPPVEDVYLPELTQKKSVFSIWTIFQEHPKKKKNDPPNNSPSKNCFQKLKKNNLQESQESQLAWDPPREHAASTGSWLASALSLASWT